MPDEQEELKTIIPEWLGRWLGPIGGIILIIAAVFELPEKLGLEPPKGDILAISVAAFFFWLWMLQYCAKWGDPLVLVLIGLLSLACAYAIPQIWFAYTSEPPSGLSYDWIFAAIAAFLLVPVAAFLSSPGAREKIAISLGLALAVSGIGFGLFRGEDWYFIDDALFSAPVGPEEVAILVAPYDHDNDKTEHLRLIGELQDQLGAKTKLGRIELIALPRRIPGTTTSDSTADGNTDNEQDEIARRIVTHKSGRVIVYGADLKKNIDTNLLVYSPGSTEEDCVESTIIPGHAYHIHGPGSQDGPNADTTMLHLIAATVVGLGRLETGQSEIAEKLFDSALKDSELLQANKNEFQRADPELVQLLKLLKADSIKDQFIAGAAQSSRADEAVQLYVQARAEPGVLAWVKTASSLAKGALLRNVSLSHTDPEQIKRDLNGAIEAYNEVIHDSIARKNACALGSAWSGVGVAHEKLAGGHGTLDLSSLTEAMRAYENSIAALTDSAEGVRRPSPETRDNFLESVENNLGVTLNKMDMQRETSRE